VVVTFADEKLVMLVLPSSERVYLPSAAQALGAREVRLAEEGEFAHLFPDCSIGAMPPFGNLHNVPVYADRLLAENETIYFQIGTHTETMSLRYADFERLVKPTVGDFRPSSFVLRP
jgi:Ala-tRNA(Pro) deacylase